MIDEKRDILNIQRGTSQGYDDDFKTNCLEVPLPDDHKLKQILMKKLKQFWAVQMQAAVTTPKLTASEVALYWMTSN